MSRNAGSTLTKPRGQKWLCGWICACMGPGWNDGIGYEIANEIEVAKERHVVNFLMGSTSVKFSNFKTETVILYLAVITHEPQGCHVD